MTESINAYHRLLRAEQAAHAQLKERVARWEAEGGPGVEDIERLAAALIKERDAHRATKARLASVQAAIQKDQDHG